MSDNWTIKVGNQVYGPYTPEEMRELSVEGRLAPYSYVAREGDTEFHQASTENDLSQLFAEVTSTPVPAEELTRYLIVADMKSRSISGLEHEIRQHGTALAISSQSWLLVTTLHLNVLRDRLMQQLGNPDHLFIADVTHNKGVWVNYGLEKESQIRQTWLKA